MNHVPSLPLLTAALAAAGYIQSAQAQLQTAPPVFVDIDATSSSLGALASITNAGTLGGVFQGFSGPVIAETPGGVARGIQFNGTAYMRLVASVGGAKINPPAGLVGQSPTRSIEVWAFNPDVASEETLVAWGKRGGPDGSNMSFNYGNNPMYGAIGHWGGAGPDIGWNDAGGAPDAGKWHHLAYTYDGTTTRVYADGVEANREELGATALNTYADTSINLATQLEADGSTPTATLRGTLFIAKVRIHDGVLSPGQILNNFNVERGAFTGPVSIVANPTNQTIIEGTGVTFTAQVRGDPPIDFQWFRNGVAIPDATSNSVTIAEVALTDNGAAYTMRATNLVNNSGALTTPAILSVRPDDGPPTLLGAVSASQSLLTVLDGVSVAFSEKVTAATANNRANYTLTGPGGAVAINGATVDSLGRSVFLTTAPLTPGATYTLAVSGVRDRSAAMNLIAPNSMTTFTASSFALSNVATNQIIAGSATTVPGGVDLAGAGRDIGGISDEFAFHSREYVGDFDVQVRLESLDLADGYSEAGLMARPVNAHNDVFAATLASPSLGGVKFQSRATLATASANTGFLPVNYPNTWLRLQRVGNVFTGLGSFDGQTWQRLGSATVVMPSTIRVGFAVNSHETNRLATARFREPVAASGGTFVNSLALPAEPLMPSSRRTGLVISEIMYHPANGSNELEFIEIFNGQDYFEDLSGFRIDGSVHYDFAPGTRLESGAFLVIARNPAALMAAYRITGVLGPWRAQTNVVGATTNVTTENLPNGQGTVRLENELGAHLLEVNYRAEDPWPVSPDGAGHSLVLARPSYGERDPRAWAASEFIGGTPGRRESYVADPLRAVVINEFLAHTDLPQLDFIELFNTSTQAVTIGGCWLSDDFETNKFQIPAGTVLGGNEHIAWTEAQLGFSLSSDGEEILLVNSNRTRVLDVVRFGGQANGVSRGRAAYSAPGIVELEMPTPGSLNAYALRRDIVINEIMYNPISGNDDDEFVELFNRATNAVNVSGWRLTDGVNFTIPNGTTIAADGYLVVARNRTNLLARYPNLASNPGLVVGDYNGQLANGGERVALAIPDTNIRTNALGVVITNTFYIVVNEVTYLDGGRWGEWSDGGGSSLELIDAKADNRLAPNWADSDETEKAPWTLVERTALIDLGMTSGQGTPNRFEMYIEGPGECLVDDVECRSNGGTNRLANPGFENGPTSWFFQGTHRRSAVQNSGARTGARCLHLSAAERGDAGANRIRSAVATMPTGTTNMATLRAWVRWLRGDPNILLRIRGQWIECSAKMTLPTNLGTPGARNSRAVPFFAGPSITDVAHAPILPAANEPIVVTARVFASDGVEHVTLLYRVDPATNFASVSMEERDPLKRDGVYTAVIPGQPAGTLVAFHIFADGDANGVSLFPSDAPFRECLVRVGETLRPGTIATYRMWLTQTNLDFWRTRERNANDGMDCTFVYGNWRVIYNAKTLYSGSPWHTQNHPYNGPLGANTCDYELQVPEDDSFLGQQDFVLNAQAATTTFFDNDTTAQAETTAYWLGRKIGLGINHKRHVFVVMNGQFRGMIYFDHQQPNQDVIEEYYPNDPNGRLHKIEDWFEFDDAGGGFEIITCTLQNFLVGGQKRPERYRFTWRPRARTEPSDFADLFALVDAANGAAPEPLTSAATGLTDVPQWMRHFALQHAVGNWDTYGYERGKNNYAYKPERGPWRMVLWDLDLVLGQQSRGTTDPLFNTAGSEPVIGNWYNHPPFRREFFCAMKDLVDGPMVPANLNPLMDARFAAFRANDVPVTTPDPVKTWVGGRRTYILSQIPNATFNVNTPAATITSNTLVLTGSAPVNAKDILVNGGEYPITWTSVTNWSVRVPLAAGANTLVVSARDRNGNSLGSRTNMVTYSGEVPSAEGSVVINEIMFNPPVDRTSFVELFNTHPSYTFDLSGWRVNGLSYTFPPGSVIAPRSYLVVGRDRFEYAKLYGGLAPMFSEFGGALQNNGETLTLLRPGATAGSEVAVDQVRYEGRAPWPANAAGRGSSLQLIDAAQDNSRVSNWGDGMGWRFYSLTGVPNGTRFLFYLDTPGNVFLDDITLVSGTVAAAGPNLLENGGFESGSLAPAWRVQGNNASNSAATADARFSGSFGLDLRFAPAGNPTQFFFQDATNIVPTAVHTLSFWYLPSTNAGNIVFRVSTGFRDTVNVRAPAGAQPVFATPGAANAVRVAVADYPPVWLNEVLPLNTSGLADAQGEREPWLELFNSSAAPVSLAGLYLSDDFANPTKWAFPAGATLQPGEFKVVFADGEANESTASEWHASFRLTSGSGSVALSRLGAGVITQPQIIDYLNFDNVPANRSYGSCPDGQLFDRQELFNVTPRAANNCSSAPLVVYINEWMAANTRDSGILDPADGDPDDWFELYNPNAFAVDLGGAFLTDNLTNQFQFEIPRNGRYTIPPRGFLLVWADGEPNQNATNRADLHVNFQLRQAGEAIGLFAADGRMIDAVTFGAQTNNVSQGRYPEGTGPISFLPIPSPRGANPNPSGTGAPRITDIHVVSSGVVSVTFSATAGRIYRVEYKDTLAPGAWTQLGANVAAAGPSASFTDNLGAHPQRFYRIGLVP